MKPLLLVNFKLYSAMLGEKGVRFLRGLATIRSSWTIAAAPSMLLLGKVSPLKGISLFAQHVDPIMEGPFTGHISVLELEQGGVRGVILNHSERRISLPVLAETVRLCTKARLVTVVCASTSAEAQRIARLRPSYIAYEPPELIGGKRSVIEVESQKLRTVVQLVKKKSHSATQVLCGAGIHSRHDVQEALRLGMAGVLVSHAVCGAKDPVKKEKELIGLR
ncbi:TPA: triose-phosphate isomerase [Candidatus Woesearchaeota archaeon]|nr:triose-phosphate isomerase [Candidatus Woesearchaeota archaeon]